MIFTEQYDLWMVDFDDEICPARIYRFFQYITTERVTQLTALKQKTYEPLTYTVSNSAKGYLTYDNLQKSSCCDWYNQLRSINSHFQHGWNWRWAFMHVSTNFMEYMLFSNFVGQCTPQWKMSPPSLKQPFSMTNLRLTVVISDIFGFYYFGPIHSSHISRSCTYQFALSCLRNKYNSWIKFLLH